MHNSDHSALVVTANGRRMNSYERELARLGFEVHTASLGSDAVHLLERGRYSAIIVDDTLEDLTALELGLTAKDILANDPLVLLVAPSQKQCIERVRPIIRIQCFDDPEELFDRLPLLMASSR